MSGQHSAQDNYGYETDYAKQAQLVRTWHQTGEEGSPLYYSNGYSGGGGWTSDPSKLSGDDLHARMKRDNIDNVYQRIMALSSEDASSAAAAWGRLGGVFDAMSQAYSKNTDQLAAGGGEGKWTAWESPAANAFYAKGPGAAMKSLHDWQAAAVANQRALNTLSGVISDYKRQMQELYDRYKAALQAAEREWNDYWNQFHDTRGLKTGESLQHEDQWNRDQYIDMMKQVRDGSVPMKATSSMDVLPMRIALATGNVNWSNEAFKLEYQMGTEFTGPIGELYSARAHRYEGPTDAVTVDSKVVNDALRNYMMSQMPHVNVNPPNIVPPVIPSFVIPIPDTGKPDPNQPNVGHTPDLGSLPDPGKTPDLGSLPDPSVVPDTGVLPVGLVPSLTAPNGLPGTSGLNANVPAGLSPSLTDGLSGLNANKGLISRPTGLNTQGLGPGMGGLEGPPGMPGSGLRGRPPGAPGLRRGVLGNNRTNANAPGEPGMPSQSQGGLNRRGLQSGSGVPPQGTLFDGLTEGAMPPSTNPVLGRPNRADGRPTVDRFGRPVVDQSLTQGVDAGSGPSVLHAPRIGTGDPGLPGLPPGAPGERRGARVGGPGYTPPAQPGDWVNGPEQEAPPATAPVIDGSVRAARLQHQEPFAPMLPPTTAGATAPVLGRTPAVDQRGAAALQRRTERGMETRRYTTDHDAAAAAGEQPGVVTDEQAFSVGTPGGGVLGSGPRADHDQETPEALQRRAANG
ncbi:MAG TPA: hypothetical protein VL738_38535 [Dactylosporangium sp.]|nr:hypothetical protein [Dactylosporangium sp.]